MKTQNHIHLGHILGGAPEKAPSEYKASEIIPSPSYFAQVDRALGGAFHAQVFAKENQAPVIYRNWTVMLRLFGEPPISGYDKFLELERYLNQLVYFVPNTHVDDGEDHTGDVKIYFMSGCEIKEHFGQTLNYLHVEIQLMDASQYGYGGGNLVTGLP